MKGGLARHHRTGNFYGGSFSVKAEGKGKREIISNIFTLLIVSVGAL